MSTNENAKFDTSLPAHELALQITVELAPKGYEDWKDIVDSDNRTTHTVTREFAFKDEIGANHAEVTRSRWDHDGKHMWSEIKTHADLKSIEALYVYIEALNVVFDEWLDQEPDYQGIEKYRGGRL